MSPKTSSTTADDGRPDGQPVRRAAEWGKQKNAGSSAEYLWNRLEGVHVIKVIILGAVVGLAWQERGWPFAAAFGKLRRAP